MTSADHQQTDAAATEAAQPATPKPIRTTLDLPPDMNRALRQWCGLAAAQADVATVPMVTVLRLLVEVLLEGEPKDDVLRDAELQQRLHRAVVRGVVRVHDPERHNGA